MRPEHRTERTLILMGIEADNFGDCFAEVTDALEATGRYQGEHWQEIERVLRKAATSTLDSSGQHVAALTLRLRTQGPDVQVLVRLAEELDTTEAGIDAIEQVETRATFIWVMLSSAATHPHIDTLAEFAQLMADPAVADTFFEAQTAEELRDAYHIALEAEVQFKAHIPAELAPTGRPFGGVIGDIRRRLPHYLGDFTDGASPKSVASILFLYFACLTPTIAFGGLIAAKTHGQMGATEMLVATAIGGVVYALLSGQPLTILGSTGPVIIFLSVFYDLCVAWNTPFLPTFACVSLWTMVFLLIIVATDTTALIRFFTRFTDDTFAALIALIFIYEAVANVLGVFGDKHSSKATALLSLNLALGTFVLARASRSVKKSPYLRTRVREFLADFGPAIAIATLSVTAMYFPHIPVERLEAPAVFGTTTGRPWLVNPFEAPRWVWFASAVPAALAAILLYLDQNITVRLVNNPRHRLKKGAGYHLDLAIIAIITGIFGIFGLPWVVAATVRSLNHVRSLATTTTTASTEQITGVIETRVTGLGVHVLVGASLLMLPVLKLVPMSVLFGLFLFMGVSAMGGNQLFERMRLWIMDPERYDPTYYLRAVPTPVVHVYTLIQTACLVMLWIVKSSAIGILFPLCIALLVPVRMAMNSTFKREHLALLDAEEVPEVEGDREGP